jgi:hypothetical protein
MGKKQLNSMLPSTASRSGSGALMNIRCNETKTIEHPLPELVEGGSLNRYEKL